jgi:hypothetical protein
VGKGNIRWQFVVLVGHVVFRERKRK